MQEQNICGENKNGFVFFKRNLFRLAMSSRFVIFIIWLVVHNLHSSSGNIQLGRSQYQEGVELLKAGDEASAFDIFQKAVNSGYPCAYSALGFFYSNGRGGVEQDDGKALEFFQKGADLGSATAQVNLARFYLEGRGVGADRERGLALMESAASSGAEDAHAALAEVYFLGLYDPESKPDFEKALPHVEASAKAGNPSATNMLGVMYREGHAVTGDLKKAEALFREAAFKGNFKAQTNLAELLDLQSKMRGKRIESAAWYIIASRQGEPMAIYQSENLQATFDKKEFEEAKAFADKLEAQMQSQ